MGPSITNTLQLQRLTGRVSAAVYALKQPFNAEECTEDRRETPANMTRLT